MHLAIGLSRYVAVRDNEAHATVAPFANGGGVELVPDTCFGVGRLLKGKRRSAALSKLLRSLGVTRPYILVQATTGLKAFARLLAHYPKQFARYQIIALPVGPAIGDDVAILKNDFSNLVELPHYLPPLRIAELISEAAGVVGTSLHLAITSTAMGVPIFRPSFAFEAKYAVLAQFKNSHAFDADGEIAAGWFEAKLAQRGPVSEMDEILARLDRHWDRIAACFAAGRQVPDIRAGILLQELSGLLESQSMQEVAAMAARDQRINQQSEVLSQHGQQVKGLLETLTERDRQVSRQTDAIRQRDEHINGLNATLAERDQEISLQKDSMTQRDEQIGQLTSTLTSRDREVGVLKNEVAQ
jgi:hypothetical protein